MNRAQVPSSLSTVICDLPSPVESPIDTLMGIAGRLRGSAGVNPNKPSPCHSSSLLTPSTKRILVETLRVPLWTFSAHILLPKAPAPPEGTESQTDTELMPPVVWAFPLSVEIKPRDGKQDKSGGDR